MRSATASSSGSRWTKKRRSSMRRESSCRTRRSRSGACSRSHRPTTDPALPGPRQPLRVLGVATNGIADELALQMLGHLLDDLPIVVEVAKGRMLASDLVSLVQAQGVSVVCLADLPPSPPSKTRYLVKKLRVALPDLRILVGRWGPTSAGGRQHAAAAGCGRDSRGVDACGDSDVPGRARRDSAGPASGGKRGPCGLTTRTMSSGGFRCPR